ncbi:hypothetical protein C2869_11700 [Saccharobesus litoralis]|uniref:Uncharacterized protein n=1 Tax=Saccharobesus litoralis TaxID=2172099 RepID=A0A2S0VS62_9ALTE|nr:hypothetical protein C2869_11700 [Saccharobesus litoralis]
MIFEPLFIWQIFDWYLIIYLGLFALVAWGCVISIGRQALISQQVWSLALNGNLVIEDVEYQLSPQSNYFLSWIFTVYVSQLSQEKTYCLFAPDNMEPVARSRLKRVIKRLRAQPLEANQQN